MEPSKTASSGRRRGSSRTWLAAAWGSTILGGVVLVLAVLNLSRVPSAELGEVSVPASGDPLEVAISRTPGGPSEWANWARVVDVVGERLGRPVRLRYLTEEDAAAKVLAEDSADLAFVCPHIYVDLRDQGLYDGLASPLIDGDATCRSLLVVASDSDASGLADLRSSVFSVSQRTSLGGYAYARWLAKREGVHLHDLFGEVRLGDAQEQNIRDLLVGEADATVVNTAQLPPSQLARVKVVEESPPLGNPPVIVSKEMDVRTRRTILDTLLRFDVSVLPEGSRIQGFAPLSDEDYRFAEELRDACGHHKEDEER